MLQPNRYLLVFIVSLILLGLCRRLILHVCKDARLKKKLFAGLFVLNALVIVGFVWSMIDFRFHWVIAVVFFLPAFVITLINILSMRFCESCGLMIYNRKFWQPAEKCRVCEK